MSEMTKRVGGREVEISRPDKVLFPKDGFAKRDLADYYERIAETMLPHLRDRPLTLERYPDGIGDDGFYQKQASDFFPDWIRRSRLPKEEGEVDYVVAEDAATLVYLANLGMVTPHVWLSRADKPEKPDRLILDLDPPGEDADAAADAARAVRSVLGELGVEPWLMTTGSRGYHVVVPLDRSATYEEVRPLAHRLAERVVARDPERLTVEQRKTKRGRRVFVDWLRNGYAQTGVAPYGVRAKPGAPVAAPIEWDELGRATPQRYTIQNVLRRLAQKQDPWRKIDDDPCAASVLRDGLD